MPHTQTQTQTTPRVMLGQAAADGALATTDQTTPAPAPVAPPNAPSWAAPTVGQLFKDATFLTVKTVAAGGAVGALVAKGARQSGAVKGAVVSATFSPAIFAVAELGSIYLSDGDGADVKKARASIVLKTTAIATGIGAALWGLYAVLKKG